jgi:hypothetical protein
MSSITVVMEPAADGTLHLPVPAEWRNQRIRVRAEMELFAADTGDGSGEDEIPMKLTPKPGSLKGFRMAEDFDAPLADFQEYVE